MKVSRLLVLGVEGGRVVRIEAEAAFGVASEGGDSGETYR